MNLQASERTMVFIDGSNLYGAARSLGMSIDYKKLRDYIQSHCQLKRMFYYTALSPDIGEHDPIRPMIDWLDYNGYHLVTKDTKEYTNHTGRSVLKGNMDIELAIHMLEMTPYMDHALLFSGDGDFVSLVEAVQRKGVKVTVVSTIKTRPPVCADELRRQTDMFVDLSDIRSVVERVKDQAA